MKRVFYLLGFLFWTATSLAGLRANFTGALYPEIRPSTVFQYRALTDESNNAIDFSGGNYVTYSDDFDNWDQTRVTVTTDQMYDPVNGELVVDYLVEDGTAANNHYVRSDTYNTVAGTTYTMSTYSYPLAKSWVRLDPTGGTPNAYYNVTTGTVGTVNCGAFRCAASISLVNGFYRCELNWNETTTTTRRIFIQLAEADNDVVFDGVLGQEALAIFGAQVVPNDRWRKGPGVYHRTTATTQPYWDLGPNGTPTTIKSTVESKGNGLPTRELDGAADWDVLAHHDSMNIFDEDHTVTAVVLQDNNAPAAADVFFDHGIFNTDGFYLQTASGTTWSGVYHNVGDNVLVSVAAAAADSRYHVVQIVRSDNTAKICVDGTCGADTDITGYGLDGPRTMYVGRYHTGNYWEGQIAFVQIDKRAKSDVKLAEDLDKLRGIASQANHATWDFERASTAVMEIPGGSTSPGNPYFVEVAAGVPRVNKDGTLVEAQSTNLITEDRAFDLNPIPWNPIFMSVPSCAEKSLGGKSDSCIFHEDNTVASVHYITHINISYTNATVYTFSVFAKENNRQWLWLRVLTTGVDPHFYCDISTCTSGTGSATTDYVNTEIYPNGWCRCSMTWTAPATESVATRIYIAEAELDPTFDGLDQDSLYIWQAQVEESPFPTSPIYTSGTEITRLADDLTMDPHETGTTEWALPETICATCPAHELTVEFDAQCRFSSSTDVSSAGHELIEISGNTGTASNVRNRLQINVLSTGAVRGNLVDDSSSGHYTTTAVNPVDFSAKHTYKVYFDLQDMSRLYLLIDGVDAGLVYSGNSGTATFDTTGTTIRAGQSYIGTATVDCWISEPRIETFEF